jgi:hypothetical protein
LNARAEWQQKIAAKVDGFKVEIRQGKVGENDMRKKSGKFSEEKE